MLLHESVAFFNMPNSFTLYEEGETLQLQVIAQCYWKQLPGMVVDANPEYVPNPETWINQVKTAIEQIKRENNSRKDFEDVAWICGTWGDLTPAQAIGLHAVSLDDGLKASIEGNDCEAVKRLLSERDWQLQAAFREKFHETSEHRLKPVKPVKL